MYPKLKFVPCFVTVLVLSIPAIWFTNPAGDFPLNDDWQYAYPVKSLIGEGELHFMGVFAPNILLQVLWGFLFCKLAGGFDFTWLRFSTLLLAVAAISVFYRLVKENNPEKRLPVVFTALVLAFNPLFYSLSFSFMSDVPFLALCLGSIYSFYRYMADEKSSWLAAAVFFAIGSYYIRQPGILLFPAFAIYMLFQKQFSGKSILTALALIIVAAFIYISLEIWIKPALLIDDNYVPVGERYYDALFHQPLITALEWGKKFLKTYFYLGFFSIPFLPFLWKQFKDFRILHPGMVLLIFVLNSILLFFLSSTGKVFPFGGNIFNNFGLGPELLADVYTLELKNTPSLPHWTMLLLNFISGVSASFLFLLIIRGYSTLSGGNRNLLWFLFLLNMMYLPVMSITSFFDRYLLLPVASFFAVLAAFLNEKSFHRLHPKWVPFVVIGLFSMVATKDYLSWNRAKNEAFEFLLSKGVPIQKMDAGYEYNGFYNYHSQRAEVPGRSFWWVNDDQWMIAFGEVPGYTSIKAFPYRRWLFLREDAILVLEKLK